MESIWKIHYNYVHTTGVRTVRTHVTYVHIRVIFTILSQINKYEIVAAIELVLFPVDFHHI